MEELDQHALALAKAIAKTETQGSKDPYKAVGDSGTSKGAYQFQPNTWKNLSKQHLKIDNAPMSVENQNKVAYMEIKRLKDAGKTPAQIASYWNSGDFEAYKKGKKGYNAKLGVYYDVPAYVEKVSNNYRQLAPKTTPQISEVPQQEVKKGFLGTNPNDTIMGKILDNSITRGIQNFFPGKKVGEAIGTLGGYLFTPKEQKQYYDTSAPTPLQVAGDVAQGALSIYGAKMPIKTSFIGKVGQSAKLGGYLSGTGAIAEGKDAKDVLKDTLSGAGVGASIPVVGVGAKYLTDKLPKSLMTKAIGEKVSKIKQGKSVSEYAISKRRVGTASKLVEKSQKEIDRIESLVDNALEGRTETVKATDYLKKLSQTDEAKNALLKNKDVRNKIETLVPETKRLLKKDTLTIKELNQLRKIVDRTIGDRGWNATQDNFNKTLMKSFANSLRKDVKDISGTSELFSDWTNEINFRDALVDKIARGEGKQVLSFGDLIGGGIGTAIAPGAGTIAGLAGRQILNSPVVQTASAVGLRGLKKPLQMARTPLMVSAGLRKSKEKDKQQIK